MQAKAVTRQPLTSYLPNEQRLASQHGLHYPEALRRIRRLLRQTTVLIWPPSSISMTVP